MWKTININKNNIKEWGKRSALIAFPHSSNYNGYCFWHPIKLIHDGRHEAAAAIAYNNNFTFRLFKYGKGKWNKYEVIDKIEIDVEELESAFGVVNDNIVAPKVVNEYETHKPAKVEPVNAEVLEELKDD